MIEIPLFDELRLSEDAKQVFTEMQERAAAFAASEAGQRIREMHRELSGVEPLDFSIILPEVRL